ncbi:unnamed protein product [Cylindrotheca closterium]|uniref:Uncharacterized protein n=1 Tax=Cylindrotheca closterium TaxID=2856 RepID=A0AAD2G4F1_9STRA|nr:unnamed protein product [Cylindrotheca closterium]
MSSNFSVRSSLANLFGMMDGVCCAQQDDEQFKEEVTREQLEHFFALYDMKQEKPSGPGSEISTATTTISSNSTAAASRYTMFKDKR